MSADPLTLCSVRIWLRTCEHCGEDTFGKLDRPGTIDDLCSACGALLVDEVRIKEIPDVHPRRKRVPQTKEHDPSCPLAQFWDAGEWEARCSCKSRTH